MGNDLGNELAIYIHWPFCLSKCPYCDFNSHVAESVDHDHWREALLTELAHYAAQTAGRPVTSIFFGGGTPSLMAPSTAAALIDSVAQHWPVAGDLEVTLEANPTSVEMGQFQDLRAAGINRVSIGVQALDNDALVFLGRGHDRREAMDAVGLANKIFPRTSFDLIYARPGQTLEGWRRELGEALAMAGEHLSLYQLTIERGTPFYSAHRNGDFDIPDDDLGVALYDLTQEMCEAGGLPAYEISNHARPGAECRHNLTYWTGGDYVGVGPGAHGRLTRNDITLATEQIPGPTNWLAAVNKDGHATRRADPLDHRARIEEVLMMGLRLPRGISRQAFLTRQSMELEDVVEPRRLRRLLDADYLEIDEDGLRATAAGRLRLNAVLAELLV
ncbi:MAG: coproporphyrinogen III oxidase [Rhodospirillaceae bacterium]|nr:coproporphyrinogen III oxidase [Rhodospirillaceae bacterium]MBT5459630.1 coproporphyrinogen III oxidase [Rhodospirillaceae bacterium]